MPFVYILKNTETYSFYEKIKVYSQRNHDYDG